MLRVVCAWFFWFHRFFTVVVLDIFFGRWARCISAWIRPPFEYDDVAGADDTKTLNQRKYQLKEKWYGDEAERNAVSSSGNSLDGIWESCIAGARVKYPIGCDRMIHLHFINNNVPC